jgi:creatinine amidohydrolase
VLPTVPYGVNTGQSDIYLDMNLNPSTQFAILKDLITVLDRQGLKKLLVFNSHGGNDFKTMLRELGLLFPEMMLVTCSWFQMLDKSLYFEKEGDHADEMETSIMMHLRPDLVLPLAEAGDGAERKHKVKAIRERWAWAERKWSSVSADTGIGDPSQSTAEKGQRYMNDVTDKIAELICDLCELDQSNMYE